MGSYPSTPQPEILPPENQYAPPPVRRSRSMWASAPATYILTGINCGVFLLMVLRGSSIWMPTLDQLMFWGADRPNNVLIYGEWWRIVTAMFVHVGIIHLATNMWCLWNLGLLAEPLMGSFGLFAVYILTGAAGNLLSTFWNWVRPTARRFWRAFLSGWRGSVRSRLRHRRGPDHPAQIASAARSAPRSAKAAEIRHLFCRHQSRHRPVSQLWQRDHRY